MLKDRRIRNVDRRQQQCNLTGASFKDSNGVTVRNERRFIPDRRISDISEPDQQESKTA